MKPSLWLCLAMCLLLSCTKILHEIILEIPHRTSIKEFVEYKIRKGNHFADSSRIKKIHRSDIRFEVVFDSSAIYHTIVAGNQSDINKLYGFSDCGTRHHENSARFGWLWNGKAIELYAYWYNDNVRNHQLLDTVSIGNTIELAIKVLPQQYGFEIKKKTLYVTRHCDSAMIDGYQLYPYFGGDEAAPHDITIQIREL